MFVFDLQLEVSAYHAPLRLAQSAQGKSDSTGKLLAVCVCHAVENSEKPDAVPAISSAMNVVNPTRSLKRYLSLNENEITSGPSKVSVLEAPMHGELVNQGSVYSDAERPIRETGETRYSYLPRKGFSGEDRATWLVEVGGYSVKVIYVFHVATTLSDGDFDRICPKRFWRVAGIQRESWTLINFGQLQFQG